MASSKYMEWFKQKENILALVIVLVVLITHLAIIDRVEDPIYDGLSYVAEANAINSICCDGEFSERWARLAISEGYETLDEYKELGYFQHGPLSKLFLVAGIKMLGDNAWGWRIFPALFGVLAVILFYLICQRLTDQRWLPLVATFIFAFENMCFVMSSIATLDAIAFTLMLASFLVYLRGNYISAALFLALAALAKTMMALGGGVILTHWFITRRASSNLDGVKFLVAAPLAYVLLLPLFDYIAIREFVYPWDRIYNWFDTTGGGALLHNLSPDFLSKYHAIRPWEWVVRPDSLVILSDPRYEITASWTLWVFIIPVMAYAFHEAFRQRWNSLCLFALLWFAWLYLPWFVIDLAFHKVSYAYHYYPVIGSVCLAMGYVVWKLFSTALTARNRKLGWVIAAPAVVWMTAHFIMFWMMAPVH